MHKVEKMNLNIVLGFGLTSILTFSGIFITPLLLTDYFFPAEQENEFLNRKYDFSFDFHNLSTFPLPINSLQVAYREFNSSYLNHSDPYLVAVWFLRDSQAHPEKEDYHDNCSTWKVIAHPGLEYNEWNVSTWHGTNNPPIYIHNTYIAYEVMFFTQLVLDATKTMPTLNFSTLGYPRLSNNTVGQHMNDYIVPEHWILSLTITFENATSINIDVHKDGWLQHTKHEPIDWTPYGESFTIYSSGESIYMDYGVHLEDFHRAFSDYAKTHIWHINKD